MSATHKGTIKRHRRIKTLRLNAIRADNNLFKKCKSGRLDWAWYVLAHSNDPRAKRFRNAIMGANDD